jgi:hypothetical protein
VNQWRKAGKMRGEAVEGAVEPRNASISLRLLGKGSWKVRKSENRK